MKLLLVGPAYEENLSVRYLSGALLAAGHEVGIATFNTMDDLPGVLAQAKGVDLVGLSMSFQVRGREFLELSRRLKDDDPGRRVIAGGHFASCAAEPLLRDYPALDLVVIHEGEETLVELADAAERLEERLPEIRGIVYRRGAALAKNPPRRAVEDLDTLPLPDRRGPAFNLAGVPTAYLLGSRGCFESCAYCCITTLHRLAPGKRFRQRSAERVADEMASLYHDRGVRQFVFHDDTFLVPSASQNHARIDALEAALERRGVRDYAFTMKCRPADVEESILRRLRDMGLVRVFLGIETSTEVGLRCLNRRQTIAEEEVALAICTRVGVSAQFTIMTFHPDATIETVRQDLAFMRRHAGHPLNFCRAELYAGTPLEARMVEDGRASGTYLARGYSLQDAAVDLACRTTLRLMAGRCWDGRGLVNRAIGMNHLIAAAARFHAGDAMSAVRRKTAAWHRLVNSDTLDLLERILDACEQASGPSDSKLAEALRDIQDCEAATRAMLLAQLDGLRAELHAVTTPTAAGASSRPRISAGAAPLAAAAVLAMSLTACGGQTTTPAPRSDAGGHDSTIGSSEMAAPPVDAGGDVTTPGTGDATIGISEMAAPPVDGGDATIGISEMAAPPVDGGADGQ